MIVFYQIAFIVLLIAVVFFCVRPIVEAYSDRIRSKARAIAEQNSPSAKLEAKVANLEAEVMELKQQLKIVQDSADFALRIAQSDLQSDSQSRVLKIDEQIEHEMKE